MATKEKTKLQKLCDEVGKICGRYWSDYYGDEEDYGCKCYVIECIDEASYDVQDLIEEAGYEIIDDGDFCGSDWDGCMFVFKIDDNE